MVVPYFQPAWAYGGIPRLAYGLSRALLERGHRVQVVTTDALDARSRLPAGREFADGLDITRLANLSNHLAYDQQLFLPRGAAEAIDKVVEQLEGGQERCVLLGVTGAGKTFATAKVFERVA